MPTSRFEPSLIINKIKQEEVVRKSKKAKNQLKLQRCLALAKQEANDTAAKVVKIFLFSPFFLVMMKFFYLKKMFLALLTIPGYLTHPS